MICSFVCWVNYWRKKGDNAEEVFFEHFGKAFHSPDTNGDAALDEFFRDIETDPEETSKLTLLRTLFIACDYAIQAMKEEDANSKMAWSYATDAAYWIGITKSARSMKDDQVNFSELGKAGAAARHARLSDLRTWALEQYRAGQWPSANKAAHSLKDEVIKRGRTIGVSLSDENAQRTIAEWFRKSV